MHEANFRDFHPSNFRKSSRFAFCSFFVIRFLTNVNYYTNDNARSADVFLKHHGSCSGPDDHPCGSIPEEEHRQPVCGTDGRSYVSPEALWCAKLRSPKRSEICKSYDVSVINRERILPFVMLAFEFARRYFHSKFFSLINLLMSRKITRALRNFGFVSIRRRGFS